MGRSGAELRLAVVKSGERAQEEGLYCFTLGELVAPKLYAVCTGHYVMEHLWPVPIRADLPRGIESMLERYVWNRDPVRVENEIWHQELLQSTGIDAPFWSYSDSVPCLTHGDPTIANAMLRDDHSVVLCDPVPPGRRVPQIREIDQAKIVQSMLGWEAMVGGLVLPDHVMCWIEPIFLGMLDPDRVRVLAFWTGVGMLRCQQHIDPEKELGIWQWCEQIKGEMLRAAGI
jgi:hypothetical protein